MLKIIFLLKKVGEFLYMKLKKSLNGEVIKAIKICIAGLIAVYLSNIVWYAEASTMALTIFLLLASYPSASSSRGYFKKRFLANVYAFLLTAIMHPIFKGSLYGLPIVFFVIIVTYDKFNLNGKISVVSCAAGALILYISSDIVGIVGRFVSILIGGIIAIIVNELILPINLGDIVESSLMNISKDLLLNIESLINSKGVFEQKYDNFKTNLQELSVNLKTLEKDIDVISGGFHLKKYSTKLKKYNYLYQVDMAADNYLNTLFKFNKENLHSKENEREYIIELTEIIYKKHKNILEDKGIGEIINIKIDSNRLDMSNNTNILIISRLIEYLNKINTYY